jgi:hypothetical protein
MRKLTNFFFVILFLISGGNLFGQKKATLINTSLTQPDKAIVYMGVENHITLFGEIPGKYIRMERTAGPLNLRPGVKLKTVLKYNETGFDTLRVFDDDKLIVEKVYEIKKLGTFAIGIKGTRDSILSKEEFLKAAQLELYMPDGFYRPKQSISSYTITISTSNGKVLQKIKVEGISYAEALKLHLDKIQPGVTILFSDVKAILEENSIRLFDPLKIRIK